MLFRRPEKMLAVLACFQCTKQNESSPCERTLPVANPGIDESSSHPSAPVEVLMFSPFQKIPEYESLPSINDATPDVLKYTYEPKKILIYKIPAVPFRRVDSQPKKCASEGNTGSGASNPLNNLQMSKPKVISCAGSKFFRQYFEAQQKEYLETIKKIKDGNSFSSKESHRLDVLGFDFTAALDRLEADINNNAMNTHAKSVLVNYMIHLRKLLENLFASNKKLIEDIKGEMEEKSVGRIMMSIYYTQLEDVYLLLGKIGSIFSQEDVNSLCQISKDYFKDPITDSYKGFLEIRNERYFISCLTATAVHLFAKRGGADAHNWDENLRDEVRGMALKQVSSENKEGEIVNSDIEILSFSDIQKTSKLSKTESLEHEYELI
ncbi:hypothetical protein ENBRE01_3105 [Enteropsectra breve]|nr:hypothetical protein ENBRE01_3105 [Enteropsectra breve]